LRLDLVHLQFVQLDLLEARQHGSVGLERVLFVLFDQLVQLDALFQEHVALANTLVELLTQFKVDATLLLSLQLVDLLLHSLYLAFVALY
jgi:hypothetical protein